MTPSIVDQLAEIASWARRIRTEVLPLPEALRGRVHLRPSRSGIGLIGLDPDRPQRGKTGITDTKALSADLPGLFLRWCRPGTYGRPTPEKCLQSHLIAEAYRSGRRLGVESDRTTWVTRAPHLTFVTDEIALLTSAGKVVCDLLALDESGPEARAAVLELKPSRQMSRLVQQVTRYATLVDDHADAFSDLFSAVLGRPVALASPCLRFIVWPQAAGHAVDPQAGDLADLGIRPITYRETPTGYAFGD